jgi:hypothetical protein
MRPTDAAIVIRSRLQPLKPWISRSSEVGRKATVFVWEAAATQARDGIQGKESGFGR